MSRTIEGKYFCNVQQGFRLSDLEKNLKYFDTIEVTRDVLESSRSVGAAIKAEWLVKVTPQIEQKYGDVFNTYGIPVDKEKNVDDIITPNMVNNKTRAAEAAKTSHPVEEVSTAPPILSDDINLADGIGADIVGDNIFGETGREQDIITSDDSGIVPSTKDAKFKAVDLGVSKESDTDKVKVVGKLQSKPVAKVKVAKISARKL